MRKKLTRLTATLLLITGCARESVQNSVVPVAVLPPQQSFAVASANPNPTWKVDARCFLKGPAGAFDDLAVKDPSIVYSGGKYHLFYTARKTGSGNWAIGYTSASAISGLNSGTRTFLSAINGGSYFCAPEVFYFGVKGKWFLIYQSAQGASFSTSTDVANPALWTPLRTMGFTDGIDFWCISDGTNVYAFYSAQDGSHTIKRRQTTIANFPYNWSAPQVAVSNTFEAPHVYKNKADGNYYMMVEDKNDNRYFELWTTASLGGTWTQVAEKWASYHNLSYNADHWTDQVSHGEMIRSGTNERLEITNIDHCDILIQGVVNGSYPIYGDIPYELGMIHNY